MVIDKEPLESFCRTTNVIAIIATTILKLYFPLVHITNKLELLALLSLLSDIANKLANSSFFQEEYFPFFYSFRKFGF